MSSLLINLILPANIIHAFAVQQEITASLMHNALLSIVIGTALMLAKIPLPSLILPLRH